LGKERPIGRNADGIILRRVFFLLAEKGLRHPDGQHFSSCGT
jgi:hypothetical protein